MGKAGEPLAARERRKVKAGTCPACGHRYSSRRAAPVSATERRPRHRQPRPRWQPRTGLEIAAEAEPLHRLSNEARIGAGLHPRIAGTVRQQFLLGEYELAAFTAMREVEIRVRELAAEPASTIGVNLMKKAFNAGGALVDPALDPGEREATMALFWGAIGVFKNPSSHRQVRFDDPGEAADVIQLADLLHRLLDRVEARIKP